MKRASLLFMAATALLFVACGSGEESNETPAAEPVVYNLDAEGTSLWWKGEENEMHFHTGYVKVTEGSLTLVGDSVTEGSFTVDLNQVSVADSMPQEKADYLVSHLKDTAFFFTAQYPTAKVTVDGYADGKLSTTINVLGTDLKNEIPVEMTKTEEGVTFKGKFSIDFADTKMPYITEVNPETGAPGAKSEFQFDLNLVLKK